MRIAMTLAAFEPICACYDDTVDGLKSKVRKDQTNREDQTEREDQITREDETTLEDDNCPESVLADN